MDRERMRRKAGLVIYADGLIIDENCRQYHLMVKWYFYGQVATKIFHYIFHRGQGSCFSVGHGAEMCVCAYE